MPRSIIGNNEPICTYYRPSNKSIITVVIGNRNTDLVTISTNDVKTDVIIHNDRVITDVIMSNNGAIYRPIITVIIVYYVVIIV